MIVEIPSPYKLELRTGVKIGITDEQMRIIQVALAGFELTKEERSEIRSLYMMIFNDQLNQFSAKR